VSAYRVQAAASRRLDEIHAYSLETWGRERSDSYIRGLFERFDPIASRRTPWRAIPVELSVDGWFCRYERHFIYWKILSNGDVGIVTVLHERMHQMDRFLTDERG
jgi:toxin ParE1/3/4